MPTLKVAKGERKKKEAGANIDFSAIWDVLDSGLIQDEGKGTYRYIGTGDSTGENVAQLRTRQPLTAPNEPSSLEVTIVDTGKRNSICIGVCSQTYPTDLMPGGNETSIALHTEDGCVLHFPHDPEPLGFSCRRGCTVKCMLVPDPLDSSSTVVEFFKDGERVRVSTIRQPEGGLYGVVGMMSEGERIQISPPVITSWLEFSQVWEVCSPEVVQHHRGGLCSYVSPGYTSEEMIGTVRTKQRLDPLGPLSSRCFEIRIIDPGENMYIAIGICSRMYPHDMLPGWKETSVGYHADNGCLFYNCDDGKPTGHVCRKGDIMRCTIQPMDGGQKQVSVLFHRNCQLVGKLTAWTPEDGFYGSFGMMSKNECVQVSLPEISKPYTASFLSVWGAITPNIQYQDNGVFAYSGEGGPDSIGSVRSRVPLNPLSPNNTFDVKIIDPGDRCYIALGVCSHKYPGTQLPGWAENSVGFHTDNGLILDGGDDHVDTRCNCVKGDVIRCTVEPVDGSNKQINVIFHRNAILMGKVLLWNAKEGFYAQVGTMSKGEIVQIASPQTAPGSLSHDITPRSMSVPGSRSSKETPHYPHMTPVVLEESDAKQHTHSEEHIPRIQTAPVLQAPSLYGREATSSHPHTMLHPQHHGHQEIHPDDLQRHQPHRSISPPALPHPQRTIPYHCQVPAGTASPFPLQPANGHPLGQQDMVSHSVLHDGKYNPFYASQASVASAASDSDARHWSQTSTDSQRDIRSHAVTEPHIHTTPPSGRYRAHTQPVGQKPSSTHPHGPPPPLVPNFATEKSFPAGAEQKARNHTDSHSTAKAVKFTSHYVHEPIEQLKVGAAEATTSVYLLSKEENSMCRILNNASYSENGTLRCTLPTDSTDSGFMICRLQLTEKMPYFEVELVEYKTTQNVIVGVLPQNDPHNTLVGSLPHTIAYHTATGALSTNSQENRSVSRACTKGDIIGCKVEWTYKLEACDPKEEPLVNVEWFHNGCSIAVESVRAPSSGLYPAVEMTSSGIVVLIRHRMGLKPDLYFSSHPLPDNFTNIEVAQCTTEGWKCIQNARVDENDYVMFPDESSYLPTVVQAHTSFTTVKPYFEVELQYPISSYSILSVGALEKISDSKQFIPGEAPNSIALFPLLGLVMRNGNISTTLPQTIDNEMKNSSEKLRVGVGIDFHQKVPLYASTNRRVKIFFTVNCQLINTTFLTVPSTGLCPTVAVGSDFRKVGDQLLHLQFSHPQPQVSDLPLGFVRAPPNAFKRRKSRTSVAENGLPEGKETPQSLQAALPLSLSHSYFEMRIARCHESHVFSCGLTSHNVNLTCHPGDTQDSIGFHPSEGSVHHNGQSSVVCPPCSYKGAQIGCGARFPPDGSSKYMEVFFTLNGSIVSRRLVTVQQPGLFPTLGFCTKGNGILTVDLFKEDPFLDLQYSTVWRELKNMKAEGALLQATSPTETCVAQLAQSVLPHKPTYFTLAGLEVTDARIAIGFSNRITCPLLESHHRGLSEDVGDSGKAKGPQLLLQDGWVGCIVDLVMGEGLIEDKLCSVEQCSLEPSQVYGCGVEPIRDSTNHLFFLTRNKQVVFCRRFRLTDDAIFPTIFVSGQTAKMYVDACALWPLETSVGRGWGRVKHLVLQNSKIRHIATDQHAKIPVGFTQASMPIIPSSSYFEVEVCSRAVDKAIAVGLASKTYPSNTWVGWKQNSVAYHLDDGNLFTGSGMFSHKIGPKIFQGHVVGCGVNAKPSDSETKEGTKVEVFFTVNGAVIVEQRILVPSGGFYPTICLESPTESLVFHRYSRFPPVQSLMGSEWGNCYSMQQAGMVIEHSCKHRELPPKGIPRGFCQASRPFSPDRSYFEIEIVSFTVSSVIQAGVAVEIPLGCRSPSTDSVMYSCVGQIQTRSAGHKTTTSVERCGIGDVMGCRIVYTENQPTMVEFYLNKMKLQELPLLDKWKGTPLFPTIVLSQRGNAVLPKLNLSPPQLDTTSLIGWLRTERVRVKGNIAEYHPSNTEKEEVGLCQISQCLDRDLNSSFEVEILDRGKECSIAVGAASANYPAVKQPGWKENSVAYHGDDGFLFNNDPHGASFGPTWKERDVIGVGVRPLKYKTPGEDEAQVYFTKNGLEIGHTTIAIPLRGLFPSIGFHSPGEKVKITLNSSSNSLGNFNTALLHWRDMCGMQLQSTSQENQCILRYYDNGRKLPRTGIKLALAIHGEPFSEKLQYFEVELLSMGMYSAVAIGVVPKRYCLYIAPGWGKDSVAYHTDNGQLYQARDRGKYFGPIAKKGDVVGCGINYIPNIQRQCSIFFTYNGVEIGRIRTNIPTAGLYPSVSLMHKYDKVRVTMMETFKPKVSTPEMQNIGLMRISNCSYSDQIVQFTGNTQGSAPGIAQFTMPMQKDRNYFATHVLKLEDVVIIGLAVKDYPLKYPPGSMSVSVAYDITKGSIRAVYDSNNFHKFDNPELKCTVGDRVGCGLVISDSKSQPGFVYFTKNGAIVKRIELAELFEDLYPVIGFVPENRFSLLFMDWNVPLFASSNLFNC